MGSEERSSCRCHVLQSFGAVSYLSRIACALQLCSLALSSRGLRWTSVACTGMIREFCISLCSFHCWLYRQRCLKFGQRPSPLCPMMSTLQTLCRKQPFSIFFSQIKRLRNLKKLTGNEDELIIRRPMERGKRLWCRFRSPRRSNRSTYLEQMPVLRLLPVVSGRLVIDRFSSDGSLSPSTVQCADSERIRRIAVLDEGSLTTSATAEHITKKARTVSRFYV